MVAVTVTVTFTVDGRMEEVVKNKLINCEEIN